MCRNKCIVAGYLSSVHAADHLSVRCPISVRLAQRCNAPQVPNNVLCFPKIYFLQEVSHLQLHVLNHLRVLA